MSLCSALVQCHLDYACSAWYSGLSKTLKHRLQVCQNKMVRFILDMSPRESINYNVLSSIQFLNIEDRVKQLRLNHVYNIFNDRAPSNLRENFVLKSNVSTRHTRSSSNLDFVVPFIKTCQSGTFYYSGIKDWNELPKEVKVIKSKDAFKKSVKNCCSTRGFLGTIVNLYFTKRVSTFTLLITELFYQCVIIASLKCDISFILRLYCDISYSCQSFAQNWGIYLFFIT